MRGGIQLRLDVHGAERHSAAMSAAELAGLRSLAETVLIRAAGVRVFGHQALLQALDIDGSIGRLAIALLGNSAHAVRAVLFDKTAETNWSVFWHQDRTIAVRDRRHVSGFGAWSIKGGVTHVEPPFEVIAKMISLRAHLDVCDAQNAPLFIVPGSHQLGRVLAGQAADIAHRFGHAICLASAGDIWAYATSIVHASQRAQVPSRRRVLQVDYANTQLPGGLEWLGITR